MIKIAKSAIDELASGAEGFQRAVDAHVQALKAHRTTVGEPRPMAPMIVESAVKRVPGGGENGMDDFVADYEIEEDKGPKLSFAEKRAQTLAAIQNAENLATLRVAGAGKLKLMNLDLVRINRGMAKRKTDALAAAHAGGKAVTDAEAKALMDKVESDFKTVFPEDSKRLEEIDKARDDIEAIARKSAELMAEVEDMDEAQLDAFEMPAWARTS